MKLGSLFDGSGGFPLAGVINGIKPVWASEIEPYPMRVTEARFPEMKQLGDVTKINGAEIEKVDIITFGSPCQDLSVAGKQKGIHEGERSNLFFEAVRIIKEMREDDRGGIRQGICAQVGVLMGGQGAKAGSVAYDEDVSPTLRATPSGSNQTPDVVYALDQQGGKGGANYAEDVVPTICNDSHGTPHGIVYQRIARTLTAEHDSSPCVDRGQNIVVLDCRNMTGNSEVSGTLQAKNEGGFSLNFVNPIVYDQQRFGQYGNSGTASSLKARDYKDATDLIVYAHRRYIVRRLTPLECCRLQGFPDNWEDGVQGSDSARYKMWGNGIALPCAADVLRRIAKEIKRDETTD